MASPATIRTRKEQQRRHAEFERQADGGDAEIRAQRIERAARQIDDLLHAEHELQPGGHQKQYRGVERPAEDDVHQFSHASDRHLSDF